MARKKKVPKNVNFWGREKKVFEPLPMPQGVAGLRYFFRMEDVEVPESAPVKIKRVPRLNRELRAERRLVFGNTKGRYDTMRSMTAAQKATFLKSFQTWEPQG